MKRRTPWPEIDERVVGVVVAVDPVRPVAELDGLLDVVIARIHARVIGGSALGAGERKRAKEKRGDQNQKTKGPSLETVPSHGHLYLKNVASKFDPWICTWQSVQA